MIYGRAVYLVRLLVPIALGATLLTLAAQLTGCHATPSGTRIPIPESGAVVARQEAKDKTLLDSAQRIDTTVADTPAAVPVRVQTDAIREAVATAPAAEVASLAKDFTDALDKQAAQLAALEQKLQKEELKGTRTDKHWLRTSGASLLLAFTLSLVFGKASTASRTWPLALLGASAFALAEIIGTAWLQLGTLALLAAAIIYAAYWLINTHRQRRLLRELVPILDQAYESANDDIRRVLDRTIFDRLSDALPRADKQLVHTIRQEAAHG